MLDPVAEVVALLQPDTRYSKSVTGAGRWRVHGSIIGEPFYCVVLDGALQVTSDTGAIVTLQADDFILVPAGQEFTITSRDPPRKKAGDSVPVRQPDGGFRIGVQDGPPDVALCVGHCAFASPDADLLVSLLPRFVHVHGDKHLAALAQLLADEFRAQHPARGTVLAHLLQVLFIAALRHATKAESPGLVAGLADARIAPALRAIHAHPDQAWTVSELARQAALSRSAFFERFSRVVGKPPMEYLLSWRMALAKDLLRRHAASVAVVAERVGYGSASAFSVAFTRHVGVPPSRYRTEVGLLPVAANGNGADTEPVSAIEGLTT